MTVPAKPAGPYTLDANNAHAAGANVYAMDVAESDNALAPVALGRTRADGYYSAKGGVTAVTDAYGTGLKKPAGGTDDYIQFSGYAYATPQSYNIPFTKVMVIKRAAAASIVLFHTGIKLSTDYGYSNGHQMIGVNGAGAAYMNKSNLVEVGSTAAGSVPEDTVCCFGVSYDGSVLTFALDGVVIGTNANVVTGFTGPETVGMGGGGEGDGRGEFTCYWYMDWPTAKDGDALQVLTANPYQLVGLAGGGDPPPPVDTTPPIFVSAVANNTLFTGGFPGIEITFSEAIQTPDFDASAFTLSGHTIGTNMDTSGIAQKKLVLLINEALSYGETVTLGYTQPGGAIGVKDAAGNKLATFSGQAVTNSTPNASAPSLPGYELITFGDDPNHDFSDINALVSYCQGLDLLTLGKPGMVWAYKDMNLANQQLGPLTSNASLMLNVRPAPGMSFDELEASNAPGAYGTVGIRITVGTEGGFRVGADVRGFRMHIPASNTSLYQAVFFRRNTWGQAGEIARFKYNRVLIETGATPFGSGEYGCAVDVTDNFFIMTAASDKVLWSASSAATFKRNTVVRLGAAAGTAALSGGFSDCNDNIYYNCGSAPQGTISGANNFSNVALNPASTSTTAYTGTFFNDLAGGDYRPAAGSPMIGGAGAGSVSINDNNGNNRGLAPDVGAFQLTPAQPLAQGQVTQQMLDGQSLTIAIATQNEVASAKVMLSPANPSNGAVSAGPFNMTIGTGVANIVIDDIEPGKYLEPAITLTNPGGSTLATGVQAFEIMGVSGGTVDPGTQNAATGLAWISKPASGQAGAASTQFVVGLDGLFNGIVNVTPSDGAGGTFSPAVVSSSDGENLVFTYTPSSTGAKTITLTNDANLTNPAPAAFTATAVQLPAPTIAITTADNAILSGDKATLAGPCNLQGDINGKVELFIDPQPSGASSGPFAANASNTSWNIQRNNLSAGTYKFRLVATANGQTTTVSSGVVRILGLTGAVGIPVT